MNSLISSSQRIFSRQKRLRLFAGRNWKHSPEFFRTQIRLQPGDKVRFLARLQPWQQRDFAALDPAWQSLAGLSVQPRFRRAWIERPRGHSKTFDTAVQIAWILLAASTPVHGLAAAADQDQARLIRNAVARLAQANPDVCGPLEFSRHSVTNRRTGSRLEILSSDVQSSWGVLPDFIICDELCHWRDVEFWQSLLSSAAKRPHCLLIVLTNAGIGRGWQWELRESVRQSGQWYFSSLVGARAPWITEESLAEQRQLLTPPVYQRLWENIWQHSDGEFLTLAEAEACRDPSLKPRTRGLPGRHYTAAIDYAEKHDYTAACLIHWEGPRLVVDRLDVAVPRPDAPVPVAWVEDWIERTAAAFGSVRFVLDEYQLLGTLQRLQSRYDLRRFQFLNGKGNHALAMNLRTLILHRQVAWYLGCGRIDGPARDDLETELASLLLRESTSGHCRIDHRREAGHHDDRAFALGAACLEAVAGNSTDWIDVTPPDSSGNFAW